jgi:hypothetical protein
VVNAAKVLKARFAPRAKEVVVAKAEAKPVRMAATNCVRAKPALHAVSVANVASAQSVLLVNVHPAKVAAMAAERAATTAEMKAAVMPCQSWVPMAPKCAKSVLHAAKAVVSVANVVKAAVNVVNAVKEMLPPAMPTPLQAK